MLVDSHCHLDYFTPMELPEILSRAAAAGVDEMVTIGTTLAQSERLPPMTEAFANLWCTIGVHPHHAAEAPVPIAGNPRRNDPPSSRHRHRQVRPRLFLRQIARVTFRPTTFGPTSAAPGSLACRFASTPATPTTISR